MQNKGKSHDLNWNLHITHLSLLTASNVIVKQTSVDKLQNA